MSKDFRVTVGVHQGSVLSPLLFILIMDVVTRDLHQRPPWTLLYADDVMLADTDKANLQNQVQAWSDRLAQFGLRLNVKKTEYMTTDADEHGSITINNTNLPRTSAFRYLGSTFSDDGSLATEVTARINAAWLKWRSATDVLCVKKITDRLKSKVYKTVVRPVAIYGAECWPATKEAERRLRVMEKKMLRWISGITRLDHVRNDDIRERYGVVPIAEKLRESRLRWYGHVLRADDGTIAMTGFTLEVPGARPRGRPKQRWTNTLHNDLKIAGLHPDKALDRDLWRQQARRADPATLRDKH
uniref:Reverse transcriptase domain-containing protein n=1 Tax=Plectus sambesii TaxID=2011161 RepID=A0A914WJ88_9BILA